MIRWLEVSESRYVESLRRILAVLRAIDGSSSISEIAQRLGWRRATLYTVLKALESMGLVELRAVSGVPKKVVPKLTSRGEELRKCLDKVFT